MKGSLFTAGGEGPVEKRGWTYMSASSCRGAKFKCTTTEGKCMVTEGVLEGVNVWSVFLWLCCGQCLVQTIF